MTARRVAPRRPFRKLAALGIGLSTLLLCIASILNFRATRELDLRVEESQRLSVFGQQIATLQKANRSLNEPPNDIFQTANPAAEHQRFITNRQTLASMLHTISVSSAELKRRRYPDSVYTTFILADSTLASLFRLSQRASACAETTLIVYAKGDRERATNWMALSDRACKAFALTLDEILAQVDQRKQTMIAEIDSFSDTQYFYQLALALALAGLVVLISFVGYHIQRELRHLVRSADHRLHDVLLQERIIKDQRTRLETILSGISDCVIVTDEMLYITYCNSAVEELLGVQAGELSGRHLTDVVEFHEYTRRVIESEDQELKSPELIDRGTRLAAIRLKNSTTIIVEYTVTIADDLEHSSVLVLRDISERIREHESLQLQNQKLSAAKRLARLAAIDIDLHTLTLRCSHHFLVLAEMSEYDFPQYEYTPEEFSSRFYFPVNDATLREHLEACRNPVDPSVSARFERYVHLGNGSEHWWLHHFSLERDENGNPKRLFGIIQDITELKSQQLRAEQLALAAEQAGAAVVVLDAVGRITWVNNSFEHLTGQTLENLKGMNPRDKGFGPSTDMRTVEKLNESIVKQRYFEGELLDYHISGRSYWIWITLNPIFLNGKCEGFVCVAHDITVQKERDQYLRVTQLSVDRSADAILWLAESGEIRYANEAAAYLVNLGITELKFSSISQFVPDFDPIRWRLMATSIREKSAMVVENRLTPTGKPDCRVEFRFHSLVAGKDSLIVAYITDISARKEAEDKLRISEHKMRLFIENLPAGAILVEGERITINRSVEQITGYGRQQLPTVQSWFATLFPNMNKELSDKYQMNLLAKFDSPEIVPFRHADGTERMGWFQSYRTDSNEVWLMRDVTEESRRDELMRRLQVAVEQSANMIVITDTQGLITFVNDRFCKFNGYEEDELIDQKMSKFKSGFTSEELYDELWSTVKRGEIWSGRIQNRKKSGEVYWERQTITPIKEENGRIGGYLSIKEDISREIVQEQKMVEADKLAAIGTLAAGVAHEFKNYLGGIIGSASYALDDLVLDDRRGATEEQLSLANDTLRSIVEMAEKANELAMSLLTYSRVTTHETENQNLSDLVKTVTKLVEKELRQRGIELLTTIEPAAEVRIVPGKIHQLLLNLLINAQQAIEGEGMISIWVRPDCDMVALSVSDSGKGIEQEHAERIFDPFFSTKGVWGKDEVVGTGMGLAVCRNIATEHGGSLTADSLPGKGTTLTLRLPAVNVSAVTPLGSHHPEASSIPLSCSVLLFTVDPKILARYQQEANQLGVSLHCFSSVDTIPPARLASMHQVVLDGRFPGKLEMVRFVGLCKEAGKSFQIVNADSTDAAISELSETSSEILTSLPPLAEILSLSDHGEVVNSIRTP